MAWLLAIYFIPFLGIFLFWLISNPKLPKKRREMQEEVNREIERVSSPSSRWGHCARMPRAGSVRWSD